MKINIITRSNDLASAMSDFFSSSHFALTTAQRGVYCQLLCMAFQNPEHELDFTIKRLATEIGVHSSTLSRYLRAMEASGLIELSRPKKVEPPKIEEKSEKLVKPEKSEKPGKSDRPDKSESSYVLSKSIPRNRKLTRRQRKKLKSRLALM